MEPTRAIIAMVFSFIDTPVLFALGAGLLTYLLAPVGWRAFARAVILALVILLAHTVWQWWDAVGMADPGLLITMILIILPALVSSAIGLWAGQRARRTRE